jgi:CRP-like cAMP-binding protein
MDLKARPQRVCNPQNLSVLNEKPWYLKELQFFENLGSAEKAMIRKKGSVKTVKKEEFVFHVGDSCEFMYILQKGIAKAFLLSSDGKEIILALRKPGDIIGLSGIYGFKRRLSYVAALEDLEILAIRTKDFEDLVTRNINLALKLIKVLEARLHHSRMIIQDLATQNVRDRLLRFLLDLAYQNGEYTSDGVVLAIKLTHEQIGQIIASSRQTVTSTLNEMRRENLIRFEGRKIVLQYQALIKYSDLL